MDVAKLNEERKKKNLSVAELAEKANLPKGTVEKVLFGIVKNPRIDTMQAIEEALGLSKPLEWTEEEKALGVGNHPAYFSKEEWDWQELRSELIRIHGEKYFETVFTMVEALKKIDKK